MTALLESTQEKAILKIKEIPEPSKVDEVMRKVKATGNDNMISIKLISGPALLARIKREKLANSKNNKTKPRV